MFPVFRVKGALAVWRINYCETQFTRCARFKKSCDGESVPNNLLPNGELLGGAVETKR